MDWNERQKIWHREKYHSDIEAARKNGRELYHNHRYKDTLIYGELAKEVDTFLKMADIIIDKNPSVMNELLERLVFRMK
jgi:hypothetical protein